MLLKPWVIFITLYFKFSFEKEYPQLINLVTDFAKLQTSPAVVIGRLCWPKDAKLKLRKQLSENYVSSEIGSVNSPLHRSSEEVYHLFLLDASCEGFEDVLHRAQELDLFKQPFRWLIMASGSYEVFVNFPICVDSKVYVTEKTGSGYEIKSFYKYSENSTDLVENYVGVWSDLQGFSQFNEVSTSMNRTDLSGTGIRISYVITSPDSFNHLWDYRDAHIDSISKLNWFLVHYLMEYVNATSIDIFTGSWGYKNATTSLYSGMIGDLQTGNAEIGGTPAFFTMDRIDIIQFVASTAPTFTKFIFKAPPLTYVTNVFTLPFDSYVWYCSFALIAVILGVIYAIVVWEWKDPIFKTKGVNAFALRPSVLDVFLLEIGAITQQGSDAEPRSNSGRIATIITLISLMFMYTSYSANIVALLQSTTESIKTLEDLLNSRISLGAEDIVYAHYYFKNADEPTRKAIYEQKMAPKGQKPNFMTALEGIQKVQQGFFAFHIELNTGYKIVNDIFQESEKCSLKAIQYLDLIEPLLVIKKNSTYQDILKVGLKKIQESGIQRREIHRVYTKKPKCQGVGGNFGSVSLLDCYAAFLIFGIGVGCSFVLMVLEMILMKYQMRKSDSSVVKLHDHSDDDTLKLY